MPNLGAGEILVILLLALLVLGPDKLPGAARSIGKGMAQFRRLSSGFEQEVRDAMNSGGNDASASSPAQVSSAPSTLHPGLGPGPRLEAGSVVLNGSTSGAGESPSSDDAGSPANGQISSDGPAGSFS